MTLSQNATVVTGPAGTGKTQFAIDLFKRSQIQSINSGLSEQSFFVLPTQEHVERIEQLILRDVSIKGMIGHHIMTISDFIRLKTFKNDYLPLATNAQRYKIVQQILQSNDWVWADPLKDSSAFIWKILGWLSELKMSQLSGADHKHLFELLDKAFPNSQGKYQDLKKILFLYQKGLESQDLIDDEDVMWKYFKAFEHEAVFSDKNAIVIFDGFYSLTSLQMNFIKLIRATTKRVYVTLCLDEARKNLFFYPNRILDELKHAGFMHQKLSSTPHRFENKSIEILEKNLFLDKKNSLAREGYPDKVNLNVATNPYQEVQNIARNILSQTKRGLYYYSDHMIICRSLSSYQRIIEDVFGYYDIPFSIHERKKLVEYPRAQRIVLWLRQFSKNERSEVILKKNYMAAFLSSQGDHEISNENHALKLRLSEENWDVCFEEFADRAEKELSQGKEKSCEYFDLVRDFLNLKSLNGIKDFFYPWLNSKELSNQERHLTSMILDILEESYLKQNSDQFDIISWAFEVQLIIEKSLYSFTPTLQNSVQIYDAVLATLKEYKSVHLIGVNKDLFPKTHYQNVIFKDHERRVLISNGYWWEAIQDRIYGEAYLFYMALTRAKNQISISYPRQDMYGRYLQESSFIDEVKDALGPNLVISEGSVEDLIPEAKSIFHKKDALLKSIFSLRKSSRDNFDEALLHYVYVESGNWIKHYKQYASRRFASPSMDAIRNFKARKNLFSATELKILNNCPYQHFVRYGLKIKPDLTNNKSVKLGLALHSFMEALYGWIHGNIGFKAVALSNMNEWSEENWEKFADTLKIEGERSANFHLRKQEFKQIIDTIIEEEFEDLSQRNNLYPEYFERKFGFKNNENTSDPIKIRLGMHQVSIVGVWDRVDVSKNKSRALIIDYKNSSGFSMTDFLRGELPQVLIYILAARESLQLSVIGVEYISLNSFKRSGLFIKDYYDEEKPRTRLRNRFTEEKFLESLDAARGAMTQDVNKFKSKEILVSPKSCRNCDYYSLCRIPKRAGV